VPWCLVFDSNAVWIPTRTTSGAAHQLRAARRTDSHAYACAGVWHSRHVHVPEPGRSGLCAARVLRIGRRGQITFFGNSSHPRRWLRRKTSSVTIARPCRRASRGGSRHGGVGERRHAARRGRPGNSSISLRRGSGSRCTLRRCTYAPKREAFAPVTNGSRFGISACCREQ